ncbi:hypothetical protein [Falsiroseomonas sp. CW058]|uniref:hypothetical protein n=1 Tax=Falsiroseomonas sp. CW058 TaxID=3388664 RepID=UPI003D31FA57
MDETLQLGLDCAAALPSRRMAVYGWAVTPRGAETGLSVSAGAAGDCAIEHVSFHPAPAAVQVDPRRAVANGFTLVVATPDAAPEVTLALAAGGAVLRADLRDPAIGSDLAKATAARDGRANAALLRAAAEDRALAPLLGHGHRPFGAFADWMAALPVLRGRAEHAPFAEVEALAAPSGEVLAVLRAGGPLPAEAEASIVPLGSPRGRDGALDLPLALPVADRHAARLPQALVAYARIAPGWADRLGGVELLVEARLRGEERGWLRIRPAAATVPDLLDAPARAAAQAGAATPGLDLLRHLLARREAAFALTLAALAAPPGAGRAPRLLLVLGIDDPAAVRMFQVTAAEFERRCDTLLLLGEAAEEAAEVFARRGRVAALAGAAAMGAVQEAAGRGGLVAVDAAVFAQSVAADRAAEAFADVLPAGEVARLLALHAVAGCAPALSDSLARLLRSRRPGPGGAGFAPIPRAWSGRAAAELVGTHLERLWAAGAAPGARPAERPLHV